jgi:P4 family phage/plasmid primase-like protien
LPSARYPDSWPQAPDNAALERVYQALYDHGSKYEAGQDFRCVAHDDRRASLGVFEGDSQPVVFNCQAGCTFTDIIRALELRPADVMLNVRRGTRNGAASSGQQQRPRSVDASPERKGSTRPRRQSDHTLQSHLDNDAPTKIREWWYQDVGGNNVALVRRRDYNCAQHPKAISQPKVNGVAAKDAPYELYRLREIRTAAAARGHVMVVAGEPSVDAAIEAGWEEPSRGKRGWTVTTMRGGEGAGKWHESYTETLAQCSHVRIVADRDLTGYRHALAVATSLGKAGVACSVWLSKTEGAHDDVVDHIKAGYGVNDLVRVKLAELRALASGEAENDAPIKKDKTSAGVTRAMEFTEAYLADFVANEHVFSDKFCWNMGLGWLRWTGKRWAPCAEASVIEGLRKFVISWMAKEGKQGAEPERLAKLLSLLSRSRITNITTLLRGRLEREAADFDNEPDLLNCLNGVIDLVTGELRAHDPKLLMTKLAGVNYFPGATHPDWTSAMSALPPSVGAYVLRRFGQAITGYPPPDDKLLILHGQGWNGKSTITTAVFKALGGYAALIPKSLLMSGARDAHSTDKMTLQGVRFAYIEELPDERKLDVAALKDSVGTPLISARPLYGKHITFPATHTLFINTNYKPIVTQTDLGTWRRLERVVFPYTYRPIGTELESKYDRRSDGRLRARVEVDVRVWEAALAAMVAAAGQWYAEGRMMPEPPVAVVKATADWRVEEDYVLRFFNEFLEFDTERHVTSADLFHTFNEWLSESGNNAWAERTLSARISGHDVLSRRVQRKKMQRRSALSLPDGGSHSNQKGAYWAWAGVKFK